MTDDSEKHLPSSWDNVEIKRTIAVEDDHYVFGHCDCCNRRRELTQCWPGGMETWACDECRHVKD